MDCSLRGEHAGRFSFSLQAPASDSHNEGRGEGVAGHLIHCPTCGNLREQKPYEVKKEAPDIFRRYNIS
jgi:hypothetical protein